MAQPQEIVVTNLKGRNGSTPPFNLVEGWCREALNVDWYESALGRKRGGATSIALTGGDAQTGQISFLGSHIPGADQSARELWSVDDAATPRFKRLAGGTSWANVTLKDNVATKPWEINAVSFNGKYFFAYDSTVNRLHVWDGSTVRRVGFPAGSAPSVANTGSGTYTATIRYYKVRWVEIVSSVVVRHGDLTEATSFTPSGSGTHARVSRPSLPDEGETHWEVYGSPDGGNYFRLSQVAAATTTYDDNTAPSAYSGTLAPDAGAGVCPPSAKYLAADDGRLVMAGVWETAAGDSFVPKANRYWWTAPLGATDNGDDERVSNTSTIKNYDDIEEDFTGLGGPINGAVFLFSYGGVWKAVNTGLAAAPYITHRITGAAGCIAHKSIIRAEDENGEACLYWLSPTGPVRYGVGGFQRCHEDIDDIWRGVNLSATTVVAHGVYHRDKHQIWWWVATGASNEPDTRIVFDVRLGRVVKTEDGDQSVRFGWAKHTGESCEARCSAMMSDTLGATMSRTLKPHIGYSTGTAIWKCDTGTDDNGTDFQSYITTRPYLPWGVRRLGALKQDAMLIAQAASGVTIQVSVDRDFGNEVLTSSCLLTAKTSPSTQTRVFKSVQDTRIAQANCVQFTIGDSAAFDGAWNLDMLVTPWVDDGQAVE